MTRFVRAIPAASAAALAAVLLALPAHAEDLVCGRGFKIVSATDRRLTCYRSAEVESETRANKLMRLWLTSAECTGRKRQPQASVATSGGTAWLVTMRFDCEARD
ncbi:MAG: hypothetical protein R3D33_07620 [Hyphomicrobiaceae bacterium]